MVTDTGGIDDRSFNASSWAGMQAAASANTNISVKYLQSTTQADYVPNINTFISQKCNIIVTVGFLMGDATKAAAKAQPEPEVRDRGLQLQARRCRTWTRWCSTRCRTASSAATWPRA